MAAVCTEDPEHILQEKPLVKPLVNDITEDEAIHALQILTGNIWNGTVYDNIRTVAPVCARRILGKS